MATRKRQPRIETTNITNEVEAALGLTLTVQATFENGLNYFMYLNGEMQGVRYSLLDASLALRQLAADRIEFQARERDLEAEIAATATALSGAVVEACDVCGATGEIIRGPYRSYCQAHARPECIFYDSHLHAFTWRGTSQGYPTYTHAAVARDAA